MDLSQIVSVAAGRGLPRTRGDGPAFELELLVAEPASPHTRGWTLGWGDAAVRRLGFPAHAGMDPRCSGGSVWPRGLPRTRGDGPRQARPPGRVVWASPHTRGWTAPKRIGMVPAPGFPAHAGMDLRRSAAAGRTSGLPRTRGDGPVASAAWVARPWASPHTRGWTRYLAAVAAGDQGFPAHAGMDPGRRGRMRQWRRLPRTRGDGPSARRRSSSRSMASPHTRGWTRRGPRVALPLRGFPAHAGMDPHRRPRRCLRPGLPRTRGDGPVAAGVAAASQRASPHTRGWTVQALVAGRGVGGFPAHAGMDPSRCRGPTWRDRLPRTRGDGPAFVLVELAAVRASPHTRGWTLELVGVVLLGVW